MTRYIANYTIVPHRGIFINHITTLDDNGKLIDIQPATEELAYTIYVPGTIALAPKAISDTFPQLIYGLFSRHDIYSALTQATLPNDIITQPLKIYKLRTVTT